MVYATGKFAPELLKLLKGSLDLEQHRRRDELKNAVREGTLSSEDIDALRAIPV